MTVQEIVRAMTRRNGMYFWNLRIEMCRDCEIDALLSKKNCMTQIESSYKKSDITVTSNEIFIQERIFVHANVVISGFHGRQF